MSVLRSDPAPDVLADLLVAASEQGGERLIETDRLLRDLVGPDAVQAAHRIWSARLRESVIHSPDPRPESGGEVFHMLHRLRPTSPGRRT